MLQSIPFRCQAVGRDNLPLFTALDALSGFGKHNSEEHNEEVRKATAYLIEVYVNSFFVSLTFIRRIIPKFAREINSLSKDQLKTIRLTEQMHKEGINVRHMVGSDVAIVHMTGINPISCN